MVSDDLAIPIASLDGQVLRVGEPVGDDLSRRLEDWIVSNLDDREAAATDSEWDELIGKLSPAFRRRKDDREVPAGPGGWARFRVAQRRGITVVAILDGTLVKEHDLDELAGDLVALIEAGHHRLVLNFASVERVSIRAVDALGRVIRACDSVAGGSLKFAGLRPEVASVLAMTGLSGRVVTCPDAASAIAGAWPEAPGLRPLPVPVLAALMGPDRDAGAGRAGLADAEEFPAMIGVRLIAQSEPFVGRVVELDGSKLVLGRGPGCGLRLGFSTVSRHHAAIERRGRRVELVDLGSTNGTRLNGRTLRGESAPLRDGDEVCVGPLAFVVAIEPIVEPRAIPTSPRSLAMPLAADSPGDTTYPDDLGLVLPDDLGEEADLKLDVVEGVVVITPRSSALDDEEAIAGLRSTLAALAERHGARRVVVNLAHVGHVSGRAIGVLLAHHLRLARDGGALRVSEAMPRVAAVFEGVHLGMLMECHPTVDDAVLAAWPRPAEERLAR